MFYFSEYTNIVQALPKSILYQVVVEGQVKRDRRCHLYRAKANVDEEEDNNYSRCKPQKLSGSGFLVNPYIKLDQKLGKFDGEFDGDNVSLPTQGEMDA